MTTVADRIRVWWVPQVPGKPFHFTVPTLDEGARMCDALARYDLFQFENRIKPDYSNMGGLEILDADGDWTSVDPDDEFDMEQARALLSERV